MLTAFAVSARKSMGALIPFEEEGGASSSCHQESASALAAPFPLTFGRFVAAVPRSVWAGCRLLRDSAGGVSASQVNRYLEEIVRVWRWCRDAAVQR